MTKPLSYTDVERIRASCWKRSTETLPAGANVPAPYVGKEGVPGQEAYSFCLPAEHAAESLLREVREPALALFVELGIPWHAGIGTGPGNHLLSSQVQCVNALGQMVHDADRIVRAFGSVLGTSEVLEIEAGRFLTFEYIGATDYFNEAPGHERVRGAHCTSVDAAFVHRTTEGVVELVLLEWKYTESYRSRVLVPAKDAIRWKRYGSALAAIDGPVRSDLLEFTDLLDEPLYQLMRQQLLAHMLEQDGAHGADRVRVVHVSPPANLAYQKSLHRPTQRALGNTVTEVWGKLQRRPDRFVSVDSKLFLDPEITSHEYNRRYGDNLALDRAEVERLCGGDVPDHLYAHVDYDGDVQVDDQGVELIVGLTGTELAYPFSLFELYGLARELEAEAEPTGS